MTSHFTWVYFSSGKWVDLFLLLESNEQIAPSQKRHNPLRHQIQSIPPHHVSPSFFYSVKLLKRFNTFEERKEKLTGYHQVKLSSWQVDRSPVKLNNAFILETYRLKCSSGRVLQILQFYHYLVNASFLYLTMFCFWIVCSWLCKLSSKVRLYPISIRLRIIIAFNIFYNKFFKLLYNCVWVYFLTYWVY